MITSCRTSTLETQIRSFFHGFGGIFKGTQSIYRWQFVGMESHHTTMIPKSKCTNPGFSVVRKDQNTKAGMEFTILKLPLHLWLQKILSAHYSAPPSKFDCFCNTQLISIYVEFFNSFICQANKGTVCN